MLSQKDVDILLKVKDKLIKKHKLCRGRGYVNEQGDVIPCICMKVFKYIRDLLKSNIPQDYWNLSLNELTVPVSQKKKVRFFINHIDNAIERGQGLLIRGETRGIGKTSLACEVAKEAVRKRYSVYYCIMQNIISDKFTKDQNINEKIIKADLIVADEFDDVMIKEGGNAIKLIENFLREILPTKKSVIICSNASLEDISKKLNIESLIRRYLQVIEITGQDYSEIKNKQLRNNLKQEVDYLTPNMQKSALQFMEYQHVADKREYEEMFGDL